MVGQSTGEPSGGRSHALDPHNRHNPSQPDDALGFAPWRPAVRRHIEDVEGLADTQALYPWGTAPPPCLRRAWAMRSAICSR